MTREGWDRVTEGEPSEISPRLLSAPLSAMFAGSGAEPRLRLLRTFPTGGPLQARPLWDGIA